MRCLTQDSGYGTALARQFAPPPQPTISDSAIWIICATVLLVAIVVGLSFGRLKERGGKAYDATFGPPPRGTDDHPRPS